MAAEFQRVFAWIFEYIAEVVNFAIDTNARPALLREVFHHVAVETFLAADDGGHDHES